MSDQTVSFKNQTDFFKYVRDHNIQFIDLVFTDLRGMIHHITESAGQFDKTKLKDGVFFDGSSVEGWCTIDASDMILIPDIRKVMVDPFAAQRTLKIFCDVHNPETQEPYDRDPRSIAKAAEKFIGESGLCDTAYFGPEPEFFVFDDVKFNTQPNGSFYTVDSEELPQNTGKHYDTGNMGHRPTHKGGYVPESPIDSLSDIRGEMLTVLETMGVDVEKHHHEVAPAQCELGIKYSTLTASADNVQLYKHVVKNVANAYGKSATFMPKPIFGDNGSGMHVHQSLWKNGKPIFAGKEYAGLSKQALFYIGGIIKHARTLNAFTNPTTNSYKRLVPGYEAPVLLSYSSRNRSASCRIPYSASEAGKRVEIRFPDPLANPYLSFAAMVMAGIDGIENEIHPGEAMDKNLYDLPKEELDTIPSVCHSLRAALDALKENHHFLLKGNVFTEDLINAYIELKTEEVELYERSIHPLEFKMYYSS